MSLETNVSGLAIRVATEIKAVRTQFAGNASGSLAGLATTNKASLIAALNELVELVSAAAGIDDDTTDPTTTWSSTKVLAEITAARDALVDGAPGALDTLGKLATALQDNYSEQDSRLTALTARVVVVETGPISAAAFGVVGDGVVGDGTGADNYAALRAAALAAETAGRALYVPRGVYRISGDAIPLPSRVEIFGDGPGHCTVFQSTSGRPVFASKNWLTAFGGAPGGRATLRGLTVRGAPGAGGHGVVLRDYYSTLDNVVAQQCGGDGFRPDARNEAGVEIGFTMVENHYRRLLADQCSGYGFNQNADNPLLTDSFVSDLVARGVAGAPGGIRIPFSAGWQITNIHTYGPFTGPGAEINRMWGTVLDGAQIEHGWTGAGLRIHGFQRAGMIDNVHIALADTGGTMLELKKHGSYPGAGPMIGNVSLVSSYPVAGTGITWDTNTAPVLVAALLISGENTSQIAPLGGFGAPAIRVVSREWADTGLRRVRHDGTSYPARPAGAPAGLVDYVGPSEPPDWVDGDTWTQTAAV